jgi:hypothetical protein
VIRVAAAVAVLIPVLLSAAPEGSEHRPDAIDVSKYPPKYQKSYELVVVKCSKCHSMAHTINGHFSPDFWRSYIRKMTRLQGSGINEKTGEVLLDFLIFYSEQRDAPDAGKP